jgi:hypothetical protein
MKLRSSIVIIGLVASAFANENGVKATEIPAGSLDMGSQASRTLRAAIALELAIPNLFAGERHGRFP